MKNCEIINIISPAFQFIVGNKIYNQQEQRSGEWQRKGQNYLKIDNNCIAGLKTKKYIL